MTASLETRPPKVARPNPNGTRSNPRPSVLVLRCDECNKRVARNGYLKINREAVAQLFESVGDWEVLDTNVAERVYWKILHAGCDTDPKQSDYRMSGHLFSTTSDLLEATAYLLRNQPDLVIGSNWHGLIGRILADTREYADWLQSPERAKQQKTRRRRAQRQGQLIDPNDPRHGTVNGYTNCNCRCEKCRAAGTEMSQRVRENRANRNGHNGAEHNGADQLVCAERA
jgi:hypothetical protein